MEFHLCHSQKKPLKAGNLQLTIPRRTMRRILRAKVYLRQEQVNKSRKKIVKNNDPRDVLQGSVLMKKVFINHLSK